MIHEHPVTAVPGAGGQMLLTREHAARPCGCQAFVGVLVPSNEGGVSATPCSPDHRAQVDAFLHLFNASLESPEEGRPAVEVADEILAMAFAAEAG